MSSSPSAAAYPSGTSPARLYARPHRDRLSDHAEASLVALGCLLRADGYRFTTVSPLTHGRVLSRPPPRSPSAADVFGWNRPFRKADLPRSWLRLMEAAGVLRDCGERLRSEVRFSTLGELMFVHSAFPTEAEDAVFFGPDTYRFVRLVKQVVCGGRAPARIVDIGAGTGAGGLCTAAMVGSRPQVTLTDINRKALRFCRINARLNGLDRVAVAESDLFDALSGSFDLIIANPPYLVDPLARLYRHGGGRLGAALSLQIVRQGIAHLAAGGRLVLYTGSAIVHGVDHLRAAIETVLVSHDLRTDYEEIDPDVFGEELQSLPYREADRIAAVALVIEKPREKSREIVKDSRGES
ncbi:MAG: class I SAM-dependent methyltransferase [Hyphomicrobiales bacterium]|nr:class I SAM-dependent methyltransferase [Hyphomicrobiales bacterium]